MAPKSGPASSPSLAELIMLVMRAWCALAAASSKMPLLTMSPAYLSTSKVNGIQACGSESILPTLLSNSVANPASKTLTSAADNEKEPNDQPTLLTPLPSSSEVASLWVTFSSMAATSPSPVVAIKPYLSNPCSVHCSAVGIGPNAQAMSAWCRGVYSAEAVGTKIWSPQKTDSLPGLERAYAPVCLITHSNMDAMPGTGSFTPGLLLFSAPGSGARRVPFPAV
mmetsp:Transcript_7927/g.17566  ORF Transcript_7927/g.17566 Transcript_7927/m.17566 type:complete len:224 (-) Transcript_7927:360-1031(-)